ncbi:MAG TPA: Ig-like domain-containing protein, partial [Gemmatimonadaceae bacterium]
MKRIVRVAGLLAMGWCIGSCGDNISGPPVDTPTTAAVSLSADTASIVPAATIQLVATAKDKQGHDLLRDFTWTTSSVAVAVVSATGTVHGIAKGTATITATADGKSASSVITVFDGGIVSSTGATLSLASGTVEIEVPPSAVGADTKIWVSPSTDFAADKRVVKGTAFDFGPPGIVFAKPLGVRIKFDPASLPAGTEKSALRLHLSTSTGWQAVEGSAIDMTNNVVTAPVSHFSTYAIVLPAEVSAVAIRGPPENPVVRDTTRIIAGESEQLDAILTDAQGQVLSNRTVTWATANSSVAAITAGGLVTTQQPGAAEISATAGTVTARVTVIVSPVPVASLSVALSTASVVVGASSQASAVVHDSRGNELSGRSVAWSSEHPEIASVNSATGVVTGIVAGTALISGSVEGHTASAPITVVPVPAASITIEPSPVTLVQGANQQLTAVVRDANGNVLTDRSVVWTSESPAIASVSGAGLLTAMAVGNTNVTATSEGKTTTISVTVAPIPVANVAVTLAATTVVAGSTTQASATTTDAAGRTLDGRSITWSVDDRGVATVSTAGVVTGVAPGAVHVAATSEGKTGAATLVVMRVPVATVVLDVSSLSLVQGSTRQLTSTAKDASENMLADRAFEWSSDNVSFATVSSTGVVSAIAVGTATITGTSEGKSATAIVTITAIPVASVEVTLATSSVIAGTTVQASAAIFDAGHKVLDRAVTWSSDNTSVATVSATGLVTTVAAGTANIVATSEGKTASAQITVSPVPPAPVAKITVTPGSLSLTVGTTGSLTGSTFDSQDATLSGRPIEWSTDAASVATVSSNGVVTAVSPGTANVVATSEGKSATVIVTVTRVPVSSVVLDASSLTLVQGSSQQINGTAKDAAENALTDRVITWSSDNTSVGTVSSTGLVRAVSPGTATITATSEGKSGSVSVTVTAIAVASVEVSLPRTSVIVGETSQATASTFDASHNALGRPVVWRSDNEAVATVSVDGLVTTLSAGTAHIIATSADISGSAAIRVDRVSVASVTLDVSSLRLEEGATHQLVAQLKDATQSTLTDRTIAWSSDNIAVATVSGDGTVTALSVGAATITATSEGKSATALVTVTPTPVASVEVKLSPSAVIAGSTSQASALTFDSNHKALGRALEWTSDNVAVATVTSTGGVTAIAAGTANIVATSEGKSGSAQMTVSPIPPAPVATVSVAPATLSLIVGATSAIVATTADVNGVALGRPVEWSTDNGGVATVSIAGVVSAVAPGTATITATSEAKSATVVVTVTRVPVASVVLDATSLDLIQGSSHQLNASAKDAAQNQLAERSIGWATDNAVVATVSSTGLVSAVGVGTATITATSEGKSATATVTVAPVPVASVEVTLSAGSVVAGTTVRASASVVDAGHTVLDRPVTWSSDNSSVATVSADGLVTTLTAGSANIIATSGGKSGSATINVSPVPPAPVATVTVTPGSLSLIVGATATLSASTFDGQGSTLAGRTIEWSTGNAAVATVSTSGVVTAVAPGTATITATSEGKTASSPITVTPVPVASVEVTLTSSRVIAGETSQATAVAYDGTHHALERVVVWSSDNTAIATVSSAGVVTTISAGTANIVATSDEKSGSAQITVSPVPPAPVATVSVSPTSLSLIAGATSTISATTVDANGIALERTVEWSTNNAAAATVSGAGEIRAVAPGTATITATSEGKSATVSVTVTAVPVATVEVTLTSSSVIAGETSQATGVTFDAHHNALERVVVWSSDNT